ncbi:hypothetical protein FACS1894142_3780 [Spirochaetia bacterium]|nr:hypothetical protein FACS1894142_3780 [Spirochaetia bacterium]
MKKFVYTALATALALTVGMLLSCKGGYTAPSTAAYHAVHGGGTTPTTSSTSSTPSSIKPAKLSSNATYGEALSKVDECIEYSNATGNGIGSSFLSIKNALEVMSPAYWSSYQTQMIQNINDLISAMP